MADIDLLRTFLTVHRTGTFTQAANELHLSQPTVSQHIKSLEAHVGRQLFTRVASRGAEPTAAANELAQAVAPHVDALEAVLEHEPADSGEGVADTLFLGGPSEFMTMRVVPILAQLVARGLRVRMYFDVDAPVVERLGTGELDMAVTTGEWRRRGFEVERLCYESLELVAAPGWADAVGPVEPGPAGARALAAAPVIAYDEHLPLVADYWLEVFQERALLRAAVVANNLPTLLMLATAGAGVTVLPTHVCQEALDRGQLVRLLGPEYAPRNQLYLTWRSGALRRESLARAHDRIVEAARNW